MNITLRQGRAEDAQRSGSICYEAFKAIAEQHHFPPDFPSAEVTTGLLSSLLTRPDIYSVVAEIDGRLVGSNFLWENASIAGIGPVTVDPKLQNAQVGKQLMNKALERARAQGFAGTRLVQAAYHSRSLSLYAKLGFVVREPLLALQGQPLGLEIKGFGVRQATERDLESCNELCRRVHGHDRNHELLDAIKQKTASVVDHNGRISGYATVIGFPGHAIGETNEDMKALIGAATSIAGPGLLIPSRNAELFRWCLNLGLRVVQPIDTDEPGALQRTCGRIPALGHLLMTLHRETRGNFRTVSARRVACYAKSLISGGRYYQWHLPCETEGRGLRIKDMRPQTLFATGSRYHLMSFDITQCHRRCVPKLSQYLRMLPGGGRWGRQCLLQRRADFDC